MSGKGGQVVVPEREVEVVTGGIDSVVDGTGVVCGSVNGSVDVSRMEVEVRSGEEKVEGSGDKVEVPGGAVVSGGAEVSGKAVVVKSEGGKVVVSGKLEVVVSSGGLAVASVVVVMTGKVVVTLGGVNGIVVV